jgi:eukaryotic-like serine/threonine-protein kinase
MAHSINNQRLFGSRRSSSEPGKPPNFAEQRSLKRELLEELRTGWETGAPVPPEELLQRWPANPEDDPDVASLLFEDYYQRNQRDAAADQVSIKDYQDRFPQHRGSLAKLFDQHSVLRSLPHDSGPDAAAGSKTLALPSVGDELFGFRLRFELGQGAFARVFLAEQPDLADRPVVLKVSAIDGDEPQTLAQLQHTHIVPIYSVHEDGRAGLRAVCMPYFGGASLSAVLNTLFLVHAVPATGEQFVQALAAVEGPQLRVECEGWKVEGKELSPSTLHTPPEPGGPLAFLRSSNYVRVAVWITARLAEALQHAHDRGILHRDVKPSNVLISADGEPMLLDFNLAQKSHRSFPNSRLGTPAQESISLGGTVSYMAPEHLHALVSRDPASARQVDARADVYSLGMVLFELLAGKNPFEHSASYSPFPALIEAMAIERSRQQPALRQQRKDIPWSLHSIALKCLAPNASQRYQRAEHLAEDLRRFLADQPLRHAPELSWRERAQKWMRRHPRLTTSATIASICAPVLVILITILGSALHQVRTAHHRVLEAEDAEARDRKARLEAGHQKVLCLGQTTLAFRDHLSETLEVSEQTLDLFGILRNADWQLQPHWQRLPSAERQPLAEAVREMLLLRARALVSLAKSKEAPAPLALREALALLDRAEAIENLEPSLALLEDRAAYLEQLGETRTSQAVRNHARNLKPSGARDHYWRASALAAANRFREAIVELDRALQLNPRHYWSWLQKGCCHEQVGELTLAAGAFNACIALWPEFSWGYFNRGCVRNKLGLQTEALADFNRVLEQDRSFVAAYFDRGMVFLALQRYAEALADFDQAAALGKTDLSLQASRALALEYLGRHAEADQDFARVLKQTPLDSQMLLAYGFAVHNRLPEQAEDAFRKVLFREPRNSRAFYGLGVLATLRSRQSREALDFFQQALEADPAFVDARRGRAYIAAQLGDWALARQDIDLCVKSQPTGVTLYGAACVYALLAKAAANPTQARWAEDRALDLLRLALDHGYGRDKAATDTDLQGIQQRQEFHRLVRKDQ